LEAFVRGITPTLRDYINTTIDARFKALDLSPPDDARSLDGATASVQFHQVDPGELAPRVRVKHKGTWDAERWFSRADAVLHKGAAYRCLSGNRNIEPGSVGSDNEWVRL
jgi:hypothetical protein